MKLSPEILFFLIFMLSIFGIGVNVLKNKNIKRTNQSEYVQEIGGQLDAILSEYGADRVALYKFSEYNEHMVGFIKYKKISCYSESVKQGITPKCYIYQNIPTLLMAKYFKVFNRADTLFVSNYKTLKNPNIRYMMNMLNCKSLYSILIRDNNNLGIGLLTLQFIKKPKKITNFNDLHETASGAKYLFLKERRK